MRFKDYLLEGTINLRTDGGKDGETPEEKQKRASALDAFLKDFDAGTEVHPWYSRMSIWKDSVGIELRKWQGMIHISNIMSFAKKNDGNASNAMKWLCQLADKHGVKMDLEVVPIKNAGAREGKSLNKAELKAWYKRNGFKPVGGDHMMREPTK